MVKSFSQKKIPIETLSVSVEITFTGRLIHNSSENQNEVR